MIHVNVRTDPAHPERPNDYIVETSTDGAGWKTQYVCPLTEGDDPITPRRTAENTARTFANGARYAGAEVRMTSCGYML